MYTKQKSSECLWAKTPFEQKMCWKHLSCASFLNFVLCFLHLLSNFVRYFGIFVWNYCFERSSGRLRLYEVLLRRVLYRCYRQIPPKPIRRRGRARRVPVRSLARYRSRLARACMPATPFTHVPCNQMAAGLTWTPTCMYTNTDRQACRQTHIRHSQAKCHSISNTHLLANCKNNIIYTRSVSYDAQK